MVSRELKHMPMNPEVQIELDLLAKECGVTQMHPDCLHCAWCEEPLYLMEKIHRVPILHKRAIHKPVHDDGSAIAYLCDKCKQENKEPIFVIHKESSNRRRCIELNVDDLPDK